MIQSLLDRNRSTRLARDLSSCGSKLSSVQSELEAFEVAFESLRDLSYGAAKQRTSSPASGARTEVVPLVASRVAFPRELKGFDPIPYLPEPFRTAYSDPGSLLTATSSGIVVPPLTTNRCEFWHLCWRWDSVDRLLLAVEDEISPEWVSNLFCLAKPDLELRQIIDRRPRNSLESPPPADAPKMGHASVFLSICVPAKGCIRGSLDDLRNYYHEFQVSDDRALPTPVGPLWFAKDFVGSRALERLKERRPDLRITANTRLHSCFAGLSMGDHWAPAIAQVAHEQLLFSCGALRANEHLRLGHPVPRAPDGHFSGVCIDDKLSLQVFPRYVPPNRPDLEPEGRDLEACAQADAAYSKVGLSCHPKNRERRAADFKAWGAHFDGDAAIVGMDRSRFTVLSFARPCWP